VGEGDGAKGRGEVEEAETGREGLEGEEGDDADGEVGAEGKINVEERPAGAASLDVVVPESPGGDSLPGEGFVTVSEGTPIW